MARGRGDEPIAHGLGDRVQREGRRRGRRAAVLGFRQAYGGGEARTGSATGLQSQWRRPHCWRRFDGGARGGGVAQWPTTKSLKHRNERARERKRVGGKGRGGQGLPGYRARGWPEGVMGSGGIRGGTAWAAAWAKRRDRVEQTTWAGAAEWGKGMARSHGGNGRGDGRASEKSVWRGRDASNMGGGGRRKMTWRVVRVVDRWDPPVSQGKRRAWERAGAVGTGQGMGHGTRPGRGKIGIGPGKFGPKHGIQLGF